MNRRRPAPFLALTAPLVLVLATAFPSASVAAGCLKYGAPGVAVVGTIVVRNVLGAPGFGATPKVDRKERLAILKLESPACVDASADNEERSETEQREITLVPSGNADVFRHEGRRVSASGVLFHSISGHDQTLLLMEVKRTPSLAAP